MIFIKEKFSITSESCATILDYEEFKDSEFGNVVGLHILRLDFNNTIFMYLEYMNDIGLKSNSYYHIVTSNKDEYNKVIHLIHSKLLTVYVEIKDKNFRDYMVELYPELEDNVESNFTNKLNTFDEVVDYNWGYFTISEREELVKYALGIDYHKDDELLSNNLYNEIKNRFKNREINAEIDYQILGNIIKDSSKRIYNNLNRGKIKFCGSIPESLNKYLNYDFNIVDTKFRDGGALITIKCHKVKYLDKLERIFNTLYSHNAEMQYKSRVYLLRCVKNINYDVVYTNDFMEVSISFLFDKVEYMEIAKGENKMIDLDMLEQKRREEVHILTPKIESIYANEEKGTIAIKWKTGETTKVTCHESDKWDLEKGIMACITKYALGNNYNAGNILNKYINSVKYTDNK